MNKTFPRRPTRLIAEHFESAPPEVQEAMLSVLRALVRNAENDMLVARLRNERREEFVRSRLTALKLSRALQALRNARFERLRDAQGRARRKRRALHWALAKKLSFGSGNWLVVHLWPWVLVILLWSVAAAIFGRSVPALFHELFQHGAQDQWQAPPSRHPSELQEDETIENPSDDLGIPVSVDLAAGEEIV